jgi:putative addiction module component (TIGR02574 family)
MPLTIEQLKAEAMKLSPEDRADLADWLWINVAFRDEVKAAWDAEIERRIRRLESGEDEGIPAEEVLAKLRAKLGR